MTAGQVVIVLLGAGLLAWTLWDVWREPTLAGKVRAVLVPVVAVLLGWFVA